MLERKRLSGAVGSMGCSDDWRLMGKWKLLVHFPFMWKVCIYHFQLIMSQRYRNLYWRMSLKYNRSPPTSGHLLHLTFSRSHIQKNVYLHMNVCFPSLYVLCASATSSASRSWSMGLYFLSDLLVAETSLPPQR